MRKAFGNKYFIAALVSSAAFITYLPALRNDFVNWDDSQYVTENPFIRSMDLRFFRWAFLDFYASNWHPLTWLSHALDYTVWGLNPLGHHLTNNILHAINTFLVVLLVVKLMESGKQYAVSTRQPSSNQAGNRSGSDSTGQQRNISRSTIHDSRFTIHDPRFVLIASATTGLLFGLHPLHVESVAWVAERKDLLCALFYLLSILTYINSQSAQGIEQRAEGKGEGTKGGWFFFTLCSLRYALCFFILALLSKPMAVSLPVVLLILDRYPFRRIESLQSLRTAVIEKIPFIALSLGSSVLTILAQKTGGAMELAGSQQLSTRLILAAKSIISYLWKMILPLDLLPLYPYPKNVSLLLPGYFLPVILVAGVTAGCLLAARKKGLWISCWGYYLVTLFPVLGIIQVGYQSMADRYTYLPSLALFLVAGLSVAWISMGRDASKPRSLMFQLFCAAAALALIVSMSSATLRQIGIWKNSITLWTYVIEKEPSSPAMAYSNRASAFNDVGKFYEAIEDYTKAISLDPSYSRAYWGRGSVFSNIGRLDRAMEDLNKAIVLGPVASVYYTRGIVYEKAGVPDKAIADYERAVAINPSYGAAYFNLGVLYGKSGLFEKAIRCFDKVIDRNPKHSPAYGKRGLAYALIGRYDKALQDLDRAIEINEMYADAYVSRGNVYLRTGNKELAGRDFQKACSLGDKESCNALQNF